MINLAEPVYSGAANAEAGEQKIITSLEESDEDRSACRNYFAVEAGNR